jgi:hypothetical protein
MMGGCHSSPARYTRAMVDAYERTSQEAIRLFLSHRISFQACEVALKTAPSVIITEVTDKELIAVTVLALKNSEAFI